MREEKDTKELLEDHAKQKEFQRHILLPTAAVSKRSQMIFSPLSPSLPSLSESLCTREHLLFTSAPSLPLFLSLSLSLSLSLVLCLFASVVTTERNLRCYRFTRLIETNSHYLAQREWTHTHSHTDL